MTFEISWEPNFPANNFAQTMGKKRRHHPYKMKICQNTRMMSTLGPARKNNKTEQEDRLARKTS